VHRIGYELNPYIRIVYVIFMSQRLQRSLEINNTRHVLVHSVEQRHSWRRGLAFIAPCKKKAKTHEILPCHISTKCVKRYELQGNKST
jgi:hypothetical protein